MFGVDGSTPISNTEPLPTAYVGRIVGLDGDDVLILFHPPTATSGSRTDYSRCQRGDLGFTDKGQWNVMPGNLETLP